MIFIVCFIEEVMRGFIQQIWQSQGFKCIAYCGVWGAWVVRYVEKLDIICHDF